MNNKSRIARFYPGVFPLLALLIACSGPLMAQEPVPVDEDGNPLASTDSPLVRSDGIEAQLPTFTSAELEEFVGPIALYPDNLLAIILPASTYPLQIVLAARFLEQLESDSTLTPDESWDESIIALLNYPEVVQMMNEDIQWTWQLGEAVISQEVQVVAAIGAFRDRAYTAGNLETDEFQNVTRGDETIVITQKEETVVYVPYYVPEEVVVYQPRRVYHYYPTPRSLYYYPYAAGHRFSSGHFWGVTTAFTIGWSDFHLHVYHPSYSRHPYYGRSYYSGYRYRRPDLRAFNRFYVDNHYRTPRNRYRDGSYWRPQRSSGTRPDYRRDRNRSYGDGGGRNVANERRRNRQPDNNRGVRSERPASRTITNNSPGVQAFSGSAGTRSNRREIDNSERRLTNLLRNSTARNSNNPGAGNRARQPRNNERVVTNDRRNRGSVEIGGGAQNRAAANRVIRQPSTANRSQRAAPAQSRSRDVDQPRTRQRAAPQPRQRSQPQPRQRAQPQPRAREPSSNRSRSSAPAASSSTRSAAPARSPQSSAREPRQNNRSNVRDRGLRREP